jgi:hypothetical protein
LKTLERALEIREFSCIARLAKPFFLLETHGPQKSTRHVAAPEPASAGK